MASAGPMDIRLGFAPVGRQAVSSVEAPLFAGSCPSEAEGRVVREEVEVNSVGAAFAQVCHKRCTAVCMARPPENPF